MGRGLPIEQRYAALGTSYRLSGRQLMLDTDAGLLRLGGESGVPQLPEGGGTSGGS